MWSRDWESSNHRSPVGHVVQGGLEALHVVHQLHGELLGALLQSPPTFRHGFICFLVVDQITDRDVLLTFTLLHVSLLVEASARPLLVLDDGGPGPGAVKVHGGVGVVQVLVAVELLVPQRLHAALQVLVVADERLGAGHEAVHHALGQGDVLLLFTAVSLQGLTRVHGLGAGPEVLGCGHLPDASVAVPRGPSLRLLDGGALLFEIPWRSGRGGQRSRLNTLLRGLRSEG